MREFGKSVRILIVAICLALFSLGILWNIFYGTMPEEISAASTSSEAISAVDSEQQAAVAGSVIPEMEITKQVQESVHSDANQIALLRMERERSWQQLQAGLAGLEFTEKQQCLKQYQEQHYREQRLELLLQAKGIADCLVLLEAEQANIIVGGAEVARQYEKIYDLVQRNSDYPPEQIVIVPLPDGERKENESH